MFNAIPAYTFYDSYVLKFITIFSFLNHNFIIFTFVIFYIVGFTKVEYIVNVL